MNQIPFLIIIDLKPNLLLGRKIYLIKSLPNKMIFNKRIMRIKTIMLNN